MLTRVEIDGFKNFEQFSLDLQPFCVVVGPNAAGKSNLFDALRLLSRLAEVDVRTALQDLRGEPHELFRLEPGGGYAQRMKICVEALLDQDFVDAYGEKHTLKNTRVRYEIGIERRAEGPASLERVFVFHEQASFIRREHDRLFVHLKGHSDALKSWALASSNLPQLITMKEGDPTIEVRQDGSGGRKRTLPLGEATASFLSTLRTGSEFKHLFALRKELSALRFLQLDPAAERMPSDVLAGDELESNGSNLATVLARIKAETATLDRPNGAIAEIRRDLAELIPGVLDLDIVRNEAARQYQLFITIRNQGRFSSRVLSDGTLRTLALLTLLHDPRRRGVLCFEEPENGIHEGRIASLIELLRSFCTDLRSLNLKGQTLSQIVVNTHSPEVLRNLKDEEVVAADTVLVSEGGQSHRRTRMRVVAADFDHMLPEDRRHWLSLAEVDRLLRRSAEAAE